MKAPNRTIIRQLLSNLPVFAASFTLVSSALAQTRSSIAPAPAEAGQGIQFSELYQCAESASSGFFRPNNNYHELILWQARTGFAESTKHEPVAITFVNPREDQNEHTILTMTPTEVLVSEARVESYRDELLRQNYRRGSVTLNLQSRMDERRGLPIVDERESISPSWGFLFQQYVGTNSLGFHTRKIFRSSDLLSNNLEINRSHVVTGSEREQALLEIQNRIHNRIRGVSRAVKYVYEGRQSLDNSYASTDGLHILSMDNRQRHPSEFYITEFDLSEIRRGLCDCSFRHWEDTVDQVKQNLADPRSGIQVWDSRTEKPRPVQVSDFGCLMG